MTLEMLTMPYLWIGAVGRMSERFTRRTTAATAIDTCRETRAADKCGPGRACEPGWSVARRSRTARQATASATLGETQLDEPRNNPSKALYRTGNRAAPATMTGLI